MRQLKTGEQIYAAIDQLATELAGSPNVRLGEVLRHRVHGVAWSSRSELFGELQHVIVDALAAENGLEERARERLREILDALRLLEP
jgi:hypothetical protein